MSCVHDVGFFSIPVVVFWNPDVMQEYFSIPDKNTGIEPNRDKNTGIEPNVQQKSWIPANCFLAEIQ